MGITRATFECDQCGIKRIVSFPTNSGRNRPKGWLIIILGPICIYACSEKCARKWSSKHMVGLPSSNPFTPKKVQDLPEPEEDTRRHVSGLLGYLEGLAEHHLEQIAEAFDVHKEILPEFLEHLGSTECPRCEAKANEECHVVEGDDVHECEKHGVHMKDVVHKERVDAAKSSWKGKLQ